MVEYHKQTAENKIEMYQSIKKVIIHHWLSSNGRICGASYNMDSLANYLQCDISEIQLHMRDKLLSTKIWNKEVQEEMVHSLMGQQVMWAMEDRMDVQSQVDILRESQGNTYKAFISAELNKALKLKQDSTTAIQNILRMFTGGTNNTLIFNQQNNVAEVSQGINVEDAVNIIGQEIEKLALPPDRDVKFLEEHYNINDINEFPQVIASLQSAERGAKEGLDIKKNIDKKATDNYAFFRTEQAESDHHQLRREIEEGILVDEEDPENSIYEEYPDLE
jgi:hypothetical protein